MLLYGRKRLLFIGAFLLISGAKSMAQIVTYPAPPGLTPSNYFTMTVNGNAVSVEELGTGLNMVNVANFSCAGSMTIVITAKDDINSFIIRPKSLGIAGQKSGNKLTFTLPGPKKLYIEVNMPASAYDGTKHLAIFANPLEVNPPKQGDANVVYYGPGASNPGTITLQSNQTIYIAGGAVVNANVRGSNVTNAKVIGRGILQGIVEVSGATNMVFDGIIVHNTIQSWTNTLMNCSQSAYRNVKVLSYPIPYATDGIDVVSCTNFKIDDCFFRCGDDCIAIKSIAYNSHVDSITVSNCVMVGWDNSDGVTIGYELNGTPVQNVLVKNCDILYARGGGLTGGHSGFSIVCDGPAWVQNIRFEDIRLEEHVESKNLELVCTNGTMYGNDSPGHIKDVYMKNIRWELNTKWIILNGYDATHLVENITFDNCYVGGKLLRSSADARISINNYTKNISFTNTATKLSSPLLTANPKIHAASKQFAASICMDATWNEDQAWSIDGRKGRAGALKTAGMVIYRKNKTEGPHSGTPR